MASRITFNVDIKGFSERLNKRFAVLANPQYLLRPVAFDLIALMTQRIHDRGQASDDLAIGTYSKGYMTVRTGNYKNAQKTKSGKIKDAGVDKNGKTRPVYNRSADTKVIISLTRQLENDWSVVDNGNSYGIGFKNKHNFDKSQWVEVTYKKKIFSLSPSEKEYAQKRFQELLSDALK